MECLYRHESEFLQNFVQGLVSCTPNCYSHHVIVCSVNLPPAIQRRVKALKNLQKSTTQIEAEFYKEVQRLEAKYHKLYQPFYDQRQTIVTGTYEPTDSECHWSDDNDEPGDVYVYLLCTRLCW